MMGLMPHLFCQSKNSFIFAIVKKRLYKSNKNFKNSGVRK